MTATIKIDGPIGNAVAWVRDKNESIEAAREHAKKIMVRHPYRGQQWLVWNLAVQVLGNELISERGDGSLLELRF